MCMLNLFIYWLFIIRHKNIKILFGIDFYEIINSIILQILYYFVSKIPSYLICSSI